eukprot:1600731-Prymnesium_polylepis.2
MPCASGTSHTDASSISFQNSAAAAASACALAAIASACACAAASSGVILRFVTSAFFDLLLALTDEVLAGFAALTDVELAGFALEDGFAVEAIFLRPGSLASGMFGDRNSERHASYRFTSLLGEEA